MHYCFLFTHGQTKPKPAFEQAANTSEGLHVHTYQTKNYDHASIAASTPILHSLNASSAFHWQIPNR